VKGFQNNLLAKCLIEHAYRRLHRTEDQRRHLGGAEDGQ
jgi:hypothetical protein